MSAEVVGLEDWQGSMDKEGHREYTIKWKVRTGSTSEGPASALTASGLAAVGDQWSLEGDIDAWAFCLPTKRAYRASKDPEKSDVWIVEQYFSTKPLWRCQTASIENPLDEPPKKGGSFVKYVREATRDKDGNPILNSAKQPIRGHVVEFDDNRPTVWIEKNYATNQLAVFSEMVDKVNDAPLWGLDARCIKLSNATWTEKWYGVCSNYYTVRYEFDINFDTFDREIADIGNMVLMPGGDASNPRDYVVAKDSFGEKIIELPLKDGQVWDGTGDPGKIKVQYYKEANFLTLGIPTTL